VEIGTDDTCYVTGLRGPNQLFSGLSNNKIRYKYDMKYNK